MEETLQASPDFFVEKAEKYIQFNDLFYNSVEAYRAFCRMLAEKYRGYTVMFCYHRKPPAVFLEEIGASLLDDAIEMRLPLPVAFSTPNAALQRISVENFEGFAALHARKNPNMYWTSERLRQSLPQWVIFQNGEAYAMASMWGDVAEVFALEADTEAVACDLLQALAGAAASNGKRELLFMVEKDKAIAKAAAERMDFAETGFYKGYSVNLQEDIASQTADKRLLPFLDAAGRLKQYPAKRAKQLLALEYLASKFERGRNYSEAEVNELLRTWHSFGDWALLRRDLYDADFLNRDKWGKAYSLAAQKTEEL